MNKFPRIHPLAAACSKANGYTLLEVSLALAAAAAIGVTTFLVFKPSDTVAAVKVESAQLAEFSQKIESSFGMVGNYSAAVTNRAVADGLVPVGYMSSGSIRNRWGGSVELAPYQVAEPADAFLVRYTSVPAEACTQLASAMAANVYDLRVAGASVFAGGDLEPGALVACGAGPMEFVFYSGLVSNAAVAATPVTNPPPVVAPPSAPPVPPGAPVAPPTAPPVVVTPPVVTPPPTVTPPPPVTPPPGVAPPPGVTPPPACTVNCNPSAPPPPYTATCEDQRAADQNRTTSCPAGTYGSVQEARVQFCRDNEAWATPEWTAWAQTGNTCTPCPGPQTETASRWDTRNLACPSGQTGTWTREHAQTQSRTGSTSCPAGTLTLPAPTWGAWGAWGDTGATRNDNNGCVTPPPVCGPAPAPETQTVACPAGQTGSVFQSRGWNAALAPTCWTVSPTWNTTSSTCVTTPPPPTSFPSYTGQYWIQFGETGSGQEWTLFTGTGSTNAGGGGTYFPTPPPVQTATPATTACISALNARHFDPVSGYWVWSAGWGFAQSPFRVEGWPAACSCSLMGSGARLYFAGDTNAMWQSEEWACP